MTTILGEHISVIKPTPPKRSIIYKDERPKVSYKGLTSTIKEHCGKVLFLVVEANNVIYAITQGTHADVMETFSIEAEEVTKVGWMLENRNFVWR